MCTCNREETKEIRLEFDFEHHHLRAPFMNCLGGINSDTPTELCSTDIRLAFQDQLDNLKIWEVDDELYCGGKKIVYNTVLFIPTHIVRDISRLERFVHVLNYPRLPHPTGLYKGEWGLLDGNIRIVLFDDAKLPANERSALGKRVFSSFLVTFNEDLSCNKATLLRSTEVHG